MQALHSKTKTKMTPGLDLEAACQTAALLNPQPTLKPEEPNKNAIASEQVKPRFSASQACKFTVSGAVHGLGV